LEAKGTLAQHRVSGPTAAVVIGLALVVLLAIFGRSSLAPKEQPPFQLPQEPTMEAREMAAIRQGLEPLGILAIMPPLIEDRQQGVRVAAVKPGGVAEAAGLRPGDLIESFNGQRVAHAVALVGLVNRTKPSASYPMSVVSGGKQETLMVTGLVSLPPEELGRLPL
jgi:S1-C subfamily serine protease